MISTRLSNILGYRKSHSCIHIHITNLIRDAHFFHERNIENNWINWTIVYLIEKFWFLSMMDSKMCRLYSKMNESQKLKKSLYFYQYRTKFTKLMPISILYRIDRETLSLLYCLLFVIRSLKIYFLISCILHLFLSSTICMIRNSYECKSPKDILIWFMSGNQYYKMIKSHQISLFYESFLFFDFFTFSTTDIEIIYFLETFSTFTNIFKFNLRSSISSDKIIFNQ